MQAKPIFNVIKSGILTTFQDMGRTGYQRYGVPVSGAMDRFALQYANILVGNQRNTACLEITLIGPALEASMPLTISITGANLEPKVNGKVKPMWQSFRMDIGDKLTFGKHQSGVRAYLAVTGGFESPVIFGSQSTDLNSGFGAKLNEADTIKGFPIDGKHGVGLSRQCIPTYESSVEVAVVKGPHTDYFTESEIDHFFATTYRVDSSSNRMGYRLNSPQSVLESSPNIWSDAVPFGGIQIPPNNQPIILMADRQTTGGYPRVGTVISSDLPKIAQLIPNGEIRFCPVSIETAQERVIESEKQLAAFAQFRSHL
ncbi:biotin-dependent carboxylase-like uncharacterized protein [Virgibacillus halotolerans]|uniref:5-oxoprolinase subunit C family protein n=1 Tax=Virgibacillus halotolerans TaxID=1071053 RepID=UPI00195F481A|nr:biotin-dependent carboxyltransferase family protein [Virgibacillus halotolerans]MBM7600505.1 biotin-dependent carboxylase-like uncharacterized protein [Virgibacillus halotolerans]